MKFIKIDDIQYAEIIEAIEGAGAHILWNLINRRKLGMSASYEDRKCFFLSVMYRLMKEGRVKIAWRGVFWDGSIDEQVQRYSDRWPKDEADLFDVDFQFIEDPVDSGLYYWAEGCFVWIYEDGFMEWT